MAKLQEVYILSLKRSAVCKAYKGGLARSRPDDILASLISNIINLDKSKNFKDLIEDVIIGCAVPEGYQGFNIARMSALLGGLSYAASGVTVSRYCASGLQSISQAYDRIAAGGADLLLAGGIESMSSVPMLGNNPRPNPKLFDDINTNNLSDLALGMGLTAENLVKKYSISREQQDEYAYLSHQKARTAQKNGKFTAQIVPVSRVKKDDGIRSVRDCTLSKLAKLKPIFANINNNINKEKSSYKPTITAGNSSQVSDGGSVVLLASGKLVKKLKLQPIARFCGYSITGVRPDVMGIAPVSAIKNVLKTVGIGRGSNLDKLSWIELNEAFSAQVLAVCKDLNLDFKDPRLNPQGGAIALGHPLGASGSILTTKLVHGLQNKQVRGSKYGVVSLCVGGGMGIAGVIEVY